MTEEEFDRLIEGDIIRGKHTGQAYIVVNTMHFGKKKVYIVNRTVTAMNPDEWDVVQQR
jgi:hypothetical protein